VTEAQQARRVLVVDDDQDIVDLLRYNLEAAGFEVSQALDGEAGLSAIRSNLPDVVILDVMMPKMDGFAVLAAVRADEATANIPVVMLTARTSDRDVWQGWNNGADYYITKPFDIGELLRFLGFLQVNGQLTS